jgi:hypothetical protein
MYKKMPRNNGTITLYEDYILKKLDRPPYDLDAVTRIYDAIKKGRIEGTVRCRVRRNLTFHLAPVGYTMKPATDDELIAAHKRGAKIYTTNASFDVVKQLYHEYNIVSI